MGSLLWLHWWFERVGDSSLVFKSAALSFRAVESQTEGQCAPMDSLWRRYSEFELLRNYLSVTYPHIVVPPLPEKRVREPKLWLALFCLFFNLLLTLFCLTRLTLFGISYQQIIWIQILWKEEELVWKTSCYVWLHILFFAKTKSFTHF